MNTQTVKTLPIGAIAPSSNGAPPAGAEPATAETRPPRHSSHAEERQAVLDQLRTGRGVTDILTALAQPQDTPNDRVRCARLLREALQELDDGTVAIAGLTRRKASRFLAFLEPEIAWLEYPAGRRRTSATRAAIVA
ncbi:MAG TPA: hypothetical protein VGL78_04250 [Solirubrobacteraceae bacterium]|jgi:hypothetical protein